MGQQPKFSTDSELTKPRHGKKDSYRVSAFVTAEMKDKIVSKALEDGITVSALMDDILDFYFDGIENVK